jgi:hypothetical protein
MKRFLLLVGLILGIYGMCCLAEWLSNVITMDLLSKLIYVAAALTMVVLIRKENKNV